MRLDDSLLSRFFFWTVPVFLIFLSLAMSNAKAADTQYVRAKCVPGGECTKIEDKPKPYNNRTVVHSQWAFWGPNTWASAWKFCKLPTNYSAEFGGTGTNCRVVRSLVEQCKSALAKSNGRYTDLAAYCERGNIGDLPDLNGPLDNIEGSSCTAAVYRTWAAQLREEQGTVRFGAPTVTDADIAWLAGFQSTGRWPDMRYGVRVSLNKPVSRLSCHEQRHVRDLVLQMAIADYNEAKSIWTVSKFVIRKMTDMIGDGFGIGDLPNLAGRIVLGKNGVLSEADYTYIEEKVGEAIKDGLENGFGFLASDGKAVRPEEPGVYAMLFQDGVRKGDGSLVVSTMLDINKRIQSHSISLCEQTVC